MALSLAQPRHLARYRDLIALFLKCGRTDLVARARLEEVLSEELPPTDKDGTSPETFVSDLERLGPTFVKLGQLLSTRPDLLPEPYLLALSRLQDNVAPVPFAEIESTVRAELGVRLSKAFRRFDRSPVVAASLGQVHHAVLRDGRSVAVKVQRPGVRLQVADDLHVLGGVAELVERYSETGARYEAVALVEQLRRSLLRELDYRVEAENMTVLGRNLERFPRLIVPQPIPDYTTSRLLTMDYVSGTKITALSPVVLLEVDAVELADVLFSAYLQQILVDGFFHADPHPGNLLVTPDGRLAMLDVGMVARLTSRVQDQLLQLLMAVSEGRGDEAVDYATRLGDPREDFRADTFARHIRALVAEHREASVRDLPVGRLVIEGLDQTKLMTAAQKIANRITLGLLLAALIIGAAQLTRIDTSFHLFGYPGLAMIFFMLAAAGALGLILSILLSDD